MNIIVNNECKLNIFTACKGVNFKLGHFEAVFFRKRSGFVFVINWYIELEVIFQKTYVKKSFFKFFQNFLIFSKFLKFFWWSSSSNVFAVYVYENIRCWSSEKVARTSKRENMVKTQFHNIGVKSVKDNFVTYLAN